MNTQAYLNRISELLSRFTEQIRAKYDINSLAENIIKPLLNKVFDAKFSKAT